MKIEKNNLPVPEKNSLKKKLKKAMIILLSLVSGIMKNTDTTIDDGKIIVVEDVGKEEFSKSLKFNSEKPNESIVKDLLKNREKKGLGTYSQETGHRKEVEQIIEATLDRIDKNFDWHATQKGTDLTKEEFKNHMISLIDKVDDIIFVDLETDELSQYTKYFYENPNVAAFYNITPLETDLGPIPSNVIIMKKDSLKVLPYYLGHELAHSEEDFNNNYLLCAQYSNIISMLREGRANSKAEFVRERGDSEEAFSLTAYDLPTVIYNKLSYFVGEKEMDEFIKNSEKNLFDFLTEHLDEKYGEGVGEKVYQYVSNLSLYFTHYTGELNQKRAQKVCKEIEMLNGMINDKVKKAETEEEIKRLKKIYHSNDNMKQMIQNILDRYENREDFDVADTKLAKKAELAKFELAKGEVYATQQKELEMLNLNCIALDIHKISNQKEALDYVQLWDYYRHRCAISKYGGLGVEKTDAQDNYKKLLNVQHQLYEKCCETNALEIKDEEIFDKMIEAQLCDVQKAKVRTNQKGTKFIISDEYFVDKLDRITNKKEIAKEEKILVEREKAEKER